MTLLKTAPGSFPVFFILEEQRAKVSISEDLWPVGQ